MVDDAVKEQVREATDIVAVIGQYVTLKKRGSNLLGLCPFHTEKTPSFSVHPDRQFYHCFGCGKGGDVFSFLMDHEGWSFPEALKYCADKAGIRLPERHAPDDAAARRRQGMQDALALADRMYRHLLFAADGEKALAYMHGRGFSDATLKRAGVGYAPDSYDRLLKAALARGFNRTVLEEAGLISLSRKTGEPFDRFRNRITFPIANLSGNTVGFGARVLSPEDEPKYLNSPETPLYHKGRILYGLHICRDAIRKEDEAILVEGYLDWLRLVDAGQENVVAVSGTALTPDQAKLIARFGKRVILLFDSDSAGQRASLRGIDVAFNAGLSVDVVALPEGDDPDSFLAREGLDALRERIRTAPGIVEYRVRIARAEAGGRLDFQKREVLIKELSDLAGRIEDPDRREAFIAETSSFLGIEQDYLRQGIKSTSDRGVAKQSTAAREILTGDSAFLRILAETPELIARAREEITVEDFEHPVHRTMFAALLNLRSLDRAPAPDDLAADDEGRAAWRRLLTYPVDPQTADRVFDDGIRRINRRRAHARAGELKLAIADAERAGDKKRAAELLAEYNRSRPSAAESP